MTSLTVELDWTYEHFLTYVLFVVANADLSIDIEELNEIKSIVDEENESDLLYDDIKKEIISKLNLQSDISEKEAFIKTNKEHFLDTEDKKEHIISCIEDVIVSDLNVDENEFVTYRTIKSILLG